MPLHWRKQLISKTPTEVLLREKYKEELLQIFSSVDAPFEVWAYGSRVNGTAHNGSDLDLVIISKDHKKLPTDIFMNLKDKVTESNIPIVVEVFDWARLPESFQRNIEVQHEVLFSNLQTTVNEPLTDYKNKPDKNDKSES